MGLIQKLNEIKTIKDDIKDAIVEKGGVLEDTTPFSNYAGVIQNLQTEDETDYTDNTDYLCYSKKNYDLVKFLCENVLNNVSTTTREIYYYTFQRCYVDVSDIFNVIKSNYFKRPSYDKSSVYPFGDEYYYYALERTFYYYNYKGELNLKFNENLPICFYETFERSIITKLSSNLESIWVGYGGSTFDYCSNLTEVPKLNIEKCICLQSMFYNCKNLKKVELIGRPFPENYVSGSIYFGTTGTAPSFSSMFSGCSSLESIKGLDITNANSNISTNNMFYGCSKLTELDFTGTENVQTNFDVSPTGLDRTGLMHMLSTLPTLDHTQTITIGSTKMSLLTDEDIAEFTAKGYTLA